MERIFTIAGAGSSRFGSSRHPQKATAARLDRGLKGPPWLKVISLVIGYRARLPTVEIRSNHKYPSHGLRELAREIYRTED